MGASGGIFAVNAVTLVDLLEHWQFEERPKLKLSLLILELMMMSESSVSFRFEVSKRLGRPADSRSSWLDCPLPVGLGYM